MLAETLDTPVVNQFAEPRLVQSIDDSVHKALAMCGTSARCVGVAAVPTREAGLITGLIGVHGKADEGADLVAHRVEAGAAAFLLDVDGGGRGPRAVELGGLEHDLAPLVGIPLAAHDVLDE